MERKIIRTDKYPQLSYTVHGTGSPLLLLHGFPLDGSIWDKVVPELANDYMVIVPDMPGSGESTFAGEELSVEEMAEGVKLILDNEGINSAIIAGHSMGGYVALAFAELYPGQMKGLGLIHSFAKADTEEKKEQRRKSIELFKKGGKEAFIRQMIPVLFSPASKSRCSEEIKVLTDRALLTENKSLIAFYNAMINRPDRIAILKNSEVPVLWVIGADDTIASPENLIQQTSLANVNFVYTCNGCGHMSMIESPKELTGYLISFAAYSYGDAKTDEK